MTLRWKHGRIDRIYTERTTCFTVQIRLSELFLPTMRQKREDHWSSDVRAPINQHGWLIALRGTKANRASRNAGVDRALSRHCPERLRRCNAGSHRLDHPGTPTHGSWLNQAEIEIGLFARQCLGRRRGGDIGQLRRQAKAWNRRTNRDRITIRWMFTRKQARKKLNYSITRS